MIRENPFNASSSEQLASVLDNAPAAVIVSSAESRELLYANDLAYRLFLSDNCRPGITCYEAAGYEKPCPFCQYEKLNRSDFLVRNHMEHESQRIYQFSGKLIDWKGRTAHIEYIVDVTDTQTKGEQARAQSEELERLKEKFDQAIQHNGEIKFDYHVWNTRKREYGCIHLEGAVKPQEDGTKLLYGVYSDVSEQRRLETALKDTQIEMDHLINSIPGGIASYRIEGKTAIPLFISDGLLSLYGYTREEYSELVKHDMIHSVYEADRGRVLSAAYAAIESGQVLDFSYRIRHKEGHLVWIHVNGRRIGQKSDSMRFYAVFTGMSAEAQLFQNIANETADRIYVIDKKNYELLYANDPNSSLCQVADCVGQSCYTALYGKEEICEFCTLNSHAPDGIEHEMEYREHGRFYNTRFRETIWNGIPAYVKYVRDITEEVQAQKEKEHMEQYFQTLVRKLPGGVVVLRAGEDGRKIPEYFSDGYAALSGMTMEELWENYSDDGMAGVHPDDVDRLNREVDEFLSSGEEQCEFIYRIERADGSYLWVKNNVSMLQRDEGDVMLYASYYDITKEREEQEQIRQQYKELILQHYRTPGPNALIIGHCNVTKNRIMEINDGTGAELLKEFGTERTAFFTGISSLVVDEKERQSFLDTFLNEPTLAAYDEGIREQELNCFIKLPKEERGRYAKVKVNLVETPDTGDITGILTVYDITDQVITDRNLHQLSTSGFDMIADVDLWNDTSVLLSGCLAADDVAGSVKRHEERLEFLIREQVVPKDKDRVAKMMEPSYMLEQLEKHSTYSFSYSALDEDGEIVTKKMTVSAADLRLGRVCLARSDITDSIREQQNLLNALAYTFELLGIIHVRSRHLTLYTRQTVLQALPPEQSNHATWFERVKKRYIPNGGPEEVASYFGMQNMLAGLAERPEGYDFVLPYEEGDGVRYKQVNVLWGDRDHKTICIVRQDVTEMLAAERRSQETLEKALIMAEEASRAKSDFLSSMSHDIRTPMNAIMGMTALAEAHPDDTEKVKRCLQKISLSSQHLLSLVNDILDMSKIERSKITLNHTLILLPELVEQLSSMMGQQAEEAGLRFLVETKGIKHACFYGDSLRINQILINLLSNAVKFTSEGGTVTFLLEEIPAVKSKGYARYRFTISDTGMGMSEEFLSHLFEPFTRNTNATRIEGTGLGLSITKGLVELMKGELAVESRVGEGSIFRVELEFEAAQENMGKDPEKKTEVSIQHANENGIAGRRFLVAEDNEINAEIISELLQLHGAESVVKPNGIQTVREFKSDVQGTYDAILMDIQMPEMNGYEATRAIRSLERGSGRHIPILAMTANAFTEDIQAAIDAGMDAHIAKPIDMQALIETLGQLME